MPQIMYETEFEKARRNKLVRKERLKSARRLGTHTPEQWQALKLEFDSRCLKCGLAGYHLDKDHIIPIYQEGSDGSDGIDNIQPLCAWCNAGKGPENTNWVNFRRQFGFEQ